MVDEVTVAVGSAEIVVLLAGLTNAGWKRVLRERAERARVGSSGNVARLSCLMSVAQASSILLASEDGMGDFLMLRVAWILRSKDSRGAVVAAFPVSSCGVMFGRENGLLERTRPVLGSRRTILNGLDIAAVIWVVWKFFDWAV
jgi:hypothetical protein